MPKPTAYKGKRLSPLLASSAQTANEALGLGEGAAPAAHGHVQADVTGLATALAAKVNDTGDENIDGVKTFVEDILFATDGKGPVLIDRTTATAYRLFVDGGVLDIEAV